MTPKPPRGYEVWWWEQLVADLDKAGYRIVPKPVLLGLGVPQRRSNA